MIKRIIYIHSIANSLEQIDGYVKKMNYQKLYDVNIIAESFYKDLLNKIF